MAYSQNSINKAKEKMSARRASAFSVAEYRKNKLYSEHPKLEEIEKQLNNIGVSTAKAVLSGENVSEQLAKLRDKSVELQKEYDSLLSSNGYPKDYLEPHFVCEKCKDTGYYETKNKTLMCDCLKKMIISCECEELNEISPLKLSTFDTFKLSYYSDQPDSQGRIPINRMSKIFNYCREYADKFSPDSKSLLMCGATGLGKTHLSLAIANEVIQNGFSVVYVSAPDILTKLSKEQFSNQSNNDTDTFRMLLDCDLLILDDLGTEFVSPYSVAAVYNVFNSRLLKSKPTIINTNYSLSELETTYSQRFMSRIMGSCDRLDFIGSDIRTKL